MISSKELNDMTKTIEILRSRAQNTKQDVTTDTDEIIRFVTEKLKTFDSDFTQLKQSTNELSEDFKQVSNNVETLNCVLKDLITNINDKFDYTSDDNDDSVISDESLSPLSPSSPSCDETSRSSFNDDDNSLSDDSSFEIIDSREATDSSFLLNRKLAKLKKQSDNLSYKALMDMLVKNVLSTRKQQDNLL